MPTAKIIGVYVIEHTATGRKYVGKSVDVAKRLRKHFTCKTGDYLHSAIRKYGPEAFSCRVLEVCASDASALVREQYWISVVGSLAPSGFNLTTGGQGMSGAIFSQTTRAKISAALKGKRKSLETRARMAASAVRRGHLAKQYV